MHSITILSHQLLLKVEHWQWTSIAWQRIDNCGRLAFVVVTTKGFTFFMTCSSSHPHRHVSKIYAASLSYKLCECAPCWHDEMIRIIWCRPRPRSLQYIFTREITHGIRLIQVRFTCQWNSYRITSTQMSIPDITVANRVHTVIWYPYFELILYANSE